MDLKFQWLISRLLEKAKPSFFGKATIIFEHGKPARLVWEESENPPK